MQAPWAPAHPDLLSPPTVPPSWLAAANVLGLGVPENERSFFAKLWATFEKRKRHCYRRCPGLKSQSCNPWQPHLHSRPGGWGPGRMGTDLPAVSLPSGATGADKSGHFRILLRVFLGRGTGPTEGCPQSRAGRGKRRGAPHPCTHVNETSPGTLAYLWVMEGRPSTASRAEAAGHRARLSLGALG